MSHIVEDFTNYKFLIGVNYILHKHDLDLLLPSTETLSHKRFEYFSDLFIHWYCNDFSIREVIIPEFYKIKFEKFKKNNKRFIAFPLVLHNKFNCDSKNKMGNHMNLILYDKKTKTIERFDSSNNTNYNTEIIDLVLFNLFKNVFNIKIRHYNVPSKDSSICPIQKIQENEISERLLGKNVGFCSYWSLWYLDYKLDHPNLTYPKIFNKLENDLIINNISFTYFIQNFFTEISIVQKYIDDKINNKWGNIISKKFKDTSESERLKIVKEILVNLSKYYNH